ncbi:MAG TPA: 5-(carboxyamino)imidazole ribonucleotide synthase, partial [Rhodospirillaceae bacterium]|nr:5-(carboxyamino)imidazole ribonucleotide synthase [Rhodospirillaceae bacterium]
ADFADAGALDAFTVDIDVATAEFENVPMAALERIARQTPIHPSPSVQAIAQNRLLEKRFANKLGIATAPFRAVSDAKALSSAIVEIGTPAILKTVRFGYDGKGQVNIDAGTDSSQAWINSGAGPDTCGGVLEGFVDFQLEISVIVARASNGEIAAFVPVENRHRNHILNETIIPAAIPETTATAAHDVAIRLCEGLGVVGLLTVEMFVTADESVLVNEIAPRPHNSGHWSIDAGRTSQYEQLVRAICGLPLGDPTRRCDAVMKNLIGNEVESWRDEISDPRACLHLYGKTEIRPGRKMGHVTRLGAPFND